MLNGAVVRNIWNPIVPAGERVFRTGTDQLADLEIIVRDGPNGKFQRGGEQLVFTVSFDRQSTTTTTVKTDGAAVIASAEQPLAVSTNSFDPFASVMRALSQAMYTGPFRNAINVGAQQTYYDIQIGDAFVRKFADYKVGCQLRNNEAIGQLVEEIWRIFGLKRLEISPEPGNSTLQLMIDDRSYRLAEQGGGLARFVVVLVNVLIRKPSFLLIDGDRPPPGPGSQDHPRVCAGEWQAGVGASAAPDPLAPFAAYLAARFADDPHIWATALFDEVLPLAYGLSYVSFGRQLRLAELRQHCEPCAGVSGRDTIEIPHAAGEEMRWDWFERRKAPWDGTAYVLLGTLPHWGRIRGVLAESPDPADRGDRRRAASARRTHTPRIWRIDRLAARAALSRIR